VDEKLTAFLELESVICACRELSRQAGEILPKLPDMKTSISRVLITFALVCFTLVPKMQAVVPPPDGGYPGFNTAEGDNALLSLTTGVANTAVGWSSLRNNTDGSFNTGVGAGTLLFNVGDQRSGEGTQNTAVGTAALLFNTTGSDNAAVGTQALFSNTEGAANTATGYQALVRNTTGNFNTAVGDLAGSTIVSGNHNACFGEGAGNGIVSANNQIAINVPAAGPFADISNSCFIGSIYNQPVSDAGSAQDTYVDQFNVLGFVPSSRRFKHDIQPMDKASEAILALKPVTFKYNSDKKGRTQYGLIAEEVAAVASDLVFRNNNGEIATVRFEQIGAMLLNEFLKAHKKVQALEETVAQQQKGMEVLTAQLKDQAAQMQKMSAQLQMTEWVAKVVVNKP